MANTLTDLMQGTLELLILKTLSRGSMHGYGIAQRIHEAVDDVLRVEDGSLYPALIVWKSVAGFHLNGVFQKITAERSFTN
jgi:DNA-binding PadR family transcriptional regulator